MIYEQNLISQDKTLLEALTQINGIQKGPLVLFVVDNDNRMVGTLTDGDSRRALISGASISDKVEKVMHRNFNHMTTENITNVFEIHRQRELLMRLVPILDKERHIVDIIDLEKNKTRLPIDAVLMAGGKGERLRPLTEHTPKPLLPIGDKAIIDYNIDNLTYYGIKNISVTVNYLKEQIEEHFAQERNGIKVVCVREPRFLGTIGSLRFVEKFENDTILVMNSDLLTNIDLEDFYLHFIETGADMSAAVFPYSVSVPYGIFNVKEDHITGLTEKPTYNYYANAGIYLIKRKALGLIPENTFFNATDLIELLISQKGKVVRFPIHGYWIDIGNKDEYSKAQDIVRHLYI